MCMETNLGKKIKESKKYLDIAYVLITKQKSKSKVKKHQTPLIILE